MVDAVLTDVMRVLADADAPTDKRDAPSSSSPPTGRDSGAWAREGPTTASIEMLPEPVPVLVVSSSFVFAYRLEAALGPVMVRAETVDDLRRLRGAIREMRPRLVVVDGAEAPVLEPAELAEEIALPGVVCVVWAREMAYARRMIESLESLEANVVSLSRKDGIDPLLDLVRSRRA